MKLKKLIILIAIILISSIIGIVAGYNTAYNENDNRIPNIIKKSISYTVNIKIDLNTPSLASYPGKAPQIKILSSKYKFIPNNKVSKSRITNGTGIILSDDGYILTNNHVISDAKNIYIKLYNGKSYKAKVVGIDDPTDIAILKINTGKHLPFAKVGNSSKAEVGQTVIAIGSPLGFENTVTKGIISAKNRQLKDIPTSITFLQTDAPINPGNSGGPLINLKGEVIGLNTAIRPEAEDIAFAIPMNTAKSIAKEIIKQGSVDRPWIGVEVKEYYPLNSSKVFIINKVSPNSPAQHAGLKINDIIRTIDGKTLTELSDIQAIINNSNTGDKFKIGVIRNNKNLYFDIKSKVLPNCI